MIPPGTWLVIESSSARPTWALLQDGIVTKEVEIEGRVSVGLFGSLAEGLKGAVPDAIIVGVGPGSFSGIRAALAAAQGMAAVWECPLHAARSSDALGLEHEQASYLGVFTDARRGMFFFTAYAHGKLLHPSGLIAASELEAYLSKCTLAVTTDGVPGVATTAQPKAAMLGRSVFQFGPGTPLQLEPIYLPPPLAVPSG